MLNSFWSRIKKNPLKLFAIFIWLCWFWLFFYFKISNNLTFSDIGNQLLNLLQSTKYGPLLFMSFYAVRTLILFPAGIMTILGGILFGPIWWCIFVFFGENASASIARWVGKKLGISTNPGEQKWIMSQIQSYIRGNDFMSTLMLRLIPFDFDLVSYVCGIYKFKWTHYALWTALGIIPGMVTYVLFGATFYGVRSFDFSDVKLNHEYLLISAVLYVVSFAIAFILKKKLHYEK